MEHSFPAAYTLLRPGAAAVDREQRAAGEDAGPLRIAFCAQEERAALRLFLRALRRLADDVDWRATVFSPTGAAPTGALRSRVRDRVTVVTPDGHDRGRGARRRRRRGRRLARPGARARAARARARRRRRARRRPACPPTRSCSATATSACCFEPGDVDVLAGQLERLARDGELLRSLGEGVRGARDGLAWDRVGDEAEAIYAGLAARRRPPRGDSELRARLRKRELIDVDLHMHTDHSHDCVTPVDVLLATARERGLGAIAVTDHNEISGALEARAKAAEYGVKVIVGEEVKTADQGEVIGLFIEEKIPRGLTLEETIAEIKRQGGLVYVPHPFDRLHSVPDYEHLLAVVDDVDAIEVFNPRIAIPAFNEEAVRFAGKYRIVGGRGLGRARGAGPRRGADPDARLRRAGGVPRVAARRRHHRPALLAVLRAGAGAEVPADEGDPLRGPPGESPAAGQEGRRAAARAKGRKPDARARRTGGRVQTGRRNARH